MPHGSMMDGDSDDNSDIESRLPVDQPIPTPISFLKRVHEIIFGDNFSDANKIAMLKLLKWEAVLPHENDSLEPDETQTDPDDLPAE